ncbi:SirB2 family protein [Psychrobacillus psychrodurans]|uniref:DUF2269 family protein n=1 Tax=Psychrobacillus psychrodurans TaxID=126157 RepID=UPI001F4EB468|nr:DUF2269 family protein [Psychrobacillus psychrodurans]MCK1995995.1 SirB2 family protein [Psychrobacillus psychrodurans]
MYTFIIFIHVISAVLSIGPFFVLFPLLNGMKGKNKEMLDTSLEVFQAAIRLVKHAGHVLVGSGILLVWQGNWPWTTSWVIMTILVMASSILFLAKAFKPNICEFQAGTIDLDTLIKKLNSNVWKYILLLLIMLWFMVAKPNLW